MGWTVINAEPLQKLDKSMIALAPHTSWRDMVIGVFTGHIIGVRVRFIGKHSLFRFPLGILMRALGGSPVDRRKNSNLVDQVVEIYRASPTYHLCIAPEGTRKKVDSFKSGFYYIARKANVPVILTKLDYQNKQVIFSDPFYLSENKDETFEMLYDYFDGVIGYHPDKSFIKQK
jgi:1-acyl-sn-glycerol-3-phosphate acyltransferase